MNQKNHGYEKMKKSFKVLMTAMLAAALSVLVSISAQAFYETNYTNNKQIAQTENSVTVALDRSYYTDSSYVTYAKNFDVYIAEDYDSLKTATPIQVPSTNTSYTFTNLKSGTQYQFKVELGYTRSSGSGTSTIASGRIVTLPGQVHNLRQDRWWRYALSIDVVWDNTGISGVEVDVRNSKNKKVKIDDMYSTTKFSVSKISNSMIYTATVRPYTIINGQKYVGSWCPKIYMFTQPEVKAASFNGKKITARWTKIAGATGYDIYLSTDNKKYTKVKSLGKKASSVTITKMKKKKLNKKKQYYVCVVSKKKVGKKTSNSGLNYTCPVKKGKPYTGGLYYTSFSTER